MLRLKGNSQIKRFYFSSDSRRLFTIGPFVKYITVWELQKGKVERKIPMPPYDEANAPETISDMALCHPNQLFVWTENPRLPVFHWNLGTDSETPESQFVCPIPFHACRPVCNQSKLLFWEAHEKLIYDPVKNTDLTFQLPTQWYTSGIDINYDGSIVSTWNYMRTLYLRQVIQPLENPVIIDNVTDVQHVRFHPSQNLIAVAFNTTVQVFDATTGQPVSQPFLHDYSVYQVEFTPDGKRMISVSYDEHVRIWDTATYAEVAKYDFGIGPLIRLAIAPDGLTFAIANYRKGEIVVADLDS